MSKVPKAFSLDSKTVDILENYCKQSDNWKKTISRSKVVNDAIVWFLSGDVAELVHGNEQLQERYGAAMRLIGDSMPHLPKKKSWWRQILGL